MHHQAADLFLFKSSIYIISELDSIVADVKVLWLFEALCTQAQVRVNLKKPYKLC